jgi:hypothetical protein
MRFTTLSERVAHRLAAALLEAGWTAESVARRTWQVLETVEAETRLGLLRDLAEDLKADYPPSPRELAAMLRRSSHFETVAAQAGTVLRDLPFGIESTPVEAREILRGLAVPNLATVGDLAGWLDIDPATLRSIAGLWRPDRAPPERRHYHSAFIPKRNGSPRLVERPKPRLKAIQRRILREILDHVPVHAAAHGFVGGRSCLSAAAMHCGEAVVVSLDLKDFFLDTKIGRIDGLFRALGYSWEVARLLTGLCTSRTPPDVFEALPEAGRPDWQTRRKFAAAHLPQGAPTSPALANLAAFSLDRRLAGLAQSLGARYTRYADDLIFSGSDGFEDRVGRLLRATGTVVVEEGFQLNAPKTRIMRRGRRQRVLGIVLNHHCSVPRDEVDRMKAILFNCRRNGPARENREAHPDFRAHLEGRVAWVEQIDPARGTKLRRLFDEIVWG